MPEATILAVSTSRMTGLSWCTLPALPAERMLPERWTCALPDGTSPVSRRVSTSSGPHGKYSEGGMLSVGRSSSISTVWP